MAPEKENFPWSLGVFDAHCHPTDTLASLESIPTMKAKVLTIMATRAQDQELVAQAAETMGLRKEDIDAEAWNKETKIVPSFGWHPWFSHQMYDAQLYEGKETLDDESKVRHYQSVLTPKPEDRDFILALPEPRPFGHFLDQMRQYLTKYPLALVGEVGLDKFFRIPNAWLPGPQARRDDSLTPGGREGRELSPYRVSMDHQKRVLSAQLAVAAQLRRAVSVHGVQAHGIVFETLRDTWKGHEKLSKRQQKRKGDNPDALSADEVDADAAGTEAEPKPYPPRICLHSFSGEGQTLQPYFNSTVPVDIFVSFSSAINFGGRGHGKAEDAIRAVPDDRILVESDLHIAGKDMDEYLEIIIRRICKLKGWELSDGVQRLGKNWKRFVFGTQQ